MESPDDWDRLTASLACAGLADEARAWAFVLSQGLVRPDAAARFAALARHERAREITGPSSAYRVAAALGREGWCTPEAASRDPRGERSAAALARWRP